MASVEKYCQEFFFKQPSALLLVWLETSDWLPEALMTDGEGANGAQAKLASAVERTGASISMRRLGQETIFPPVTFATFWNKF